MNVHVVDVTHTEPWILNSYAIHIYREGLTERSDGNRKDKRLACFLSQVKFQKLETTWLCPGSGDSGLCLVDVQKVGVAHRREGYDTPNMSPNTCFKAHLFNVSQPLVNFQSFLSQLQSCQLKFIPGEVCGVQTSKNYTSWSHFVEARKTLPKCSTGGASGENVFLSFFLLYH